MHKHAYAFVVRVLCWAVPLVTSTNPFFSDEKVERPCAPSLFARAARRGRERASLSGIPISPKFAKFPEFPPLRILRPETGPEYRESGRRGGRIRGVGDCWQTGPDFGGCQPA